jgi:hypothetical protein
MTWATRTFKSIKVCDIYHCFDPQIFLFIGETAADRPYKELMSFVKIIFRSKHRSSHLSREDLQIISIHSCFSCGKNGPVRVVATGRYLGISVLQPA